jgi:hypothetical protein
MWEILPTTRWCSSSLPSTCQGILGWHSTWTMDRSKSCYWAPTMVSRPNTSRLLPMGNLEGWSLSTKASHTECATRNRVQPSQQTHWQPQFGFIDAVQPLMWSLRTHIIFTLSPRKNCNYMSLCSKDIDYKRVSTFFWTPMYISKELEFVCWYAYFQN